MKTTGETMDGTVEPSTIDGSSPSALLDRAAARIVAGTPADAFVAWFAAEASSIAPGFDAWLRETRDERLDAGFARALWNRFPRPEARLRPRPLPPIGRNDPCPCGSGAKHKRCCLAAEPSVETLASLPLMLHVLDALPDEALGEIDITGADPDELLEALDVWGEEGAGERIVQLVAPLFGARPASGGRGDGRLPRHAPELLEVLLDHWPAGFRDRDFDALCERLAAHRDDDLASVAALARVRAASVDDLARARSLLERDARRFVDHPGFGELEVDLLNAEGRLDEAARLARTLGERVLALDPDDPELLDYAEELLERATWVDPELALERAREEDDVLDRLVVLLEETPPAPTAGSHAPIGAGRELVLEPSAVLAAVESAWAERFAVPLGRDTAPVASPHAASVDATSGDPLGTTDRDVEGGVQIDDDDALTRIVDYLDDEPLALSSFRVLDALARGAGNGDAEPWTEALRRRVLERGERLLYRHLSREAGFETPEGLPDWDAMVWDTAPRMPSAHPANRAALDLLAALAAHHRADDPSPGGRDETLRAALAGLER